MSTSAPSGATPRTWSTLDIPVRSVRGRSGGFDPTEHVSATLARTPWRYRVSLRVRAPAEQIRTRLPASMAVLQHADDGWVRVELRELVRDLAARLLAAADTSEPTG